MKPVDMAFFVVVVAITSPAVAQPKDTISGLGVPRILSVAGFDQIPTTACSGRMGPAVTVDLGEVFKDLASNGKVARKITRTVAGGTQQVGRPANVGNNWPSNLDMQLAVPKASGGFEPNDYVMVTVKLPMVRGASFLRPPLSVATNSSIAVMVDPGKGSGFCGRTDVATTVVPRGMDFQTMQFGVLKGPDVQSINIGIMIPDDPKSPAYWLPIILDPNVKNEG